MWCKKVSYLLVTCPLNYLFLVIIYGDEKMKSYPELMFEKKDSISSEIVICVNCGSDKTYQLGSDLCCGNCGLCEYVGRSD